jgi:bacterial/archaeal transporter family protein
MTAWMWLVLLYGVLKGLRDVVKKKALTKNSVIEVLFFYTLFGFLFVIPDIPSAFQMEMRFLPYIFIKSFLIFVAWLCSYAAISKMPISLYGVMDLARVLFATMLGVVVLDEVLSVWQVIGLILVLVGLILVNLKKKSKDGSTSVKYSVFALISCLLNAVSGLMDKLLMREVKSGQLQFWYMLFLLLLYFSYLIFSACRHHRINWKALKTNYWIPILSVLFMVGDRALFVANSYADSRITVMTILKQSCVLITILGGLIVFREKGIAYRLLCAGIIVTGIIIATCL